MKKIKPNKLNNCRFCSVISKNSGEDPIGSANTYDHWLAVEMKLPWREKFLWENQLLSKATAIIHQKIERGINIIGKLIAPDQEYSLPGYTRFFYYRRPGDLFAKFEKHEFIVPDSDVESFAIALLEAIPRSPFQLTDWESYRQNSSHIRELMVCTDGNVDLACGKFGSSMYQQLRSQYAGEQLRIWRISHFGGHEFAPTLLDWPLGHCWGHLSSEVLEVLIERNNVVNKLRPFYRGWTGLTQFEQIAEREIWMQEGWQWLDYQKTGRVLRIDEVNHNWAEVRIDFRNKARIQGAYEARIEANGYVMTAWNSQSDPLLKKVKQYRVSSLVKLV